MHFVVKLFPEIVVKSPPVRRLQTRILQDNIRRLLKPLDKGVEVVSDWEKIEVRCSRQDEALKDQVVERLSCTPGISKFSEIQAFDFETLEDICALAVSHYGRDMEDKSFGVRAKRSGKQSFNSMDVERAVGSALMTQTPARSVDLKRPDMWVELEVRADRLFLLGETWSGLGGFPIGSQDKVISLISGGFDSSVASYQAMRRGMLTHFLFFNIGGRAHEIATRHMAYHLWQRFGSSHDSRFITVPFEQIVSEIASKVPGNYATVILKRYMMRCASKIADKYEIDAIATGESVGQVSSQTLANLRVIDKVADCLVMRPLINMDKGEIIDIARHIGTAKMAESSPEYCGINSVRPTTKARFDKVELIESGLDTGLVDSVIAQARQIPLRKLIEDIATLPVDVLSRPNADAVVIDVRHPDERLEKALELQNNRVVPIPFFEIQKRFAEQPQDASYLLYCERGIMSRLHAELLLEAGYQNVGVYRP